MKISCENVTQKLAAYLHGEIDQAALVEWSEHAMRDSEFDYAGNDLRSEIVPSRTRRMSLSLGCDGKTAKSSFAGWATEALLPFHTVSAVRRSTPSPRDLRDALGDRLSAPVPRFKRADLRSKFKGRVLENCTLRRKRSISQDGCLPLL